MTGQVEVQSALTGIMRDSQGRLMAALIGQLNDFQLAEDVLQDALASALEHWHRSGIPNSPEGWILTVARRKAIDRIRKAGRYRARQPDLATLAQADQADSAEPPDDIPDQRLRLIFTCCHPALDPKSRVALTLRLLGGLSTQEIARGFLDMNTTMGQRLSRAKAKISAAGIPYVVPGPEEWPERLSSVLAVIYLIFNEGYSATGGDQSIRVDLCDEALWLARLMVELTRSDAEALGLLSLILTTHARRNARFGEDGRLVPLEDQDRNLWDRDLIAEGLDALDRALAANMPGGYQIKAAISALHVQAETYRSTDWRQIVLLYNELLRHERSAVVELNRAVALAEGGALDAAVAALAPLAEELDRYQPYHAARGELLSRRGDAGAKAAFERAIELSGTDAERDFLAMRLRRVSATESGA